jgi:hypothetical protein
MRLNILPAPGNAWYTMRRAGYSVPVTRFVCWSAFRMHYADGIWLENSDRWGNPREKLCRGKNGRFSGSPSAGRWDIPLMDIKACNSWRSNWIKPGKPSHLALKEMRRLISAMTVNILPDYQQPGETGGATIVASSQQSGKAATPAGRFDGTVA